MSELSKRILILGGGFGGLYTALRLDEFSWSNSHKPEIILVDKSDRFLFSPLLYELVTGEMQSWEIAPPFDELLANTNIRFHHGCVSDLNISDSLVHLDNQETLSYDKLVIALGGQTPLDFVPGAKEYAIPFRTLQDAYHLGQKLKELEQSNSEKIRVVVVGGGYSGVELACKLADRLGERGRIRIVELGEDILNSSPPHNRNAAKKALEERLVWIDLETKIEEITADTVSLLYKGQVDTIPADLVLWTVGTKVSDFIKSLPLPQNRAGKLVTNSFLQAENHPNIYILGDIADCRDKNGQQVPATAQVALQQADYCAWNLWASIMERPMLPFQYQGLGEMMTLGVDNATVNSLGLKLDGTLAYLTRRLLYLYRFPTLKHRLAVGFNWLTQPIMELLLD
ncbi:FAD-dependent pyridine nucleotide-disulphide oxidoreductase [Gloeothece citriformis PCC 7424]|uniref:demethylphylloquinone reductase n=1 Tax=Gloeothece citriformis (strain PCC 7424) TaxID=65393 RepID=B7KBF3_GLOC7|nr:NAD(P)/FAD-dependent oxidoreductase [Gloeothece citriformis]ACK71509.1 FAD-dependent pyridine nucleotide-disulphide oxidoreductase [Gloeothece citriformis PCC 7424]